MPEKYIYLRQIIQTQIEDPKVAEFVAQWQNHIASDDEMKYAEQQDAQFKDYYIPKL